MPDQVLDMNIPMLQAYVDGYQNYMFDMQCLAVHQGYWAGYYQSKKPKSVSKVLQKMEIERNKLKKINGSKVPKPEVDVNRYLGLEEKRMKYLANKRNGR